MSFNRANPFLNGSATTAPRRPLGNCNQNTNLPAPAKVPDDENFLVPNQKPPPANRYQQQENFLVEGQRPPPNQYQRTSQVNHQEENYLVPNQKPPPGRSFPANRQQQQQQEEENFLVAGQKPPPGNRFSTNQQQQDNFLVPGQKPPPGNRFAAQRQTQQPQQQENFLPPTQKGPPARLLQRQQQRQQQQQQQQQEDQYFAQAEQQANRYGSTTTYTNSNNRVSQQQQPLGAQSLQMRRQQLRQQQQQQQRRDTLFDDDAPPSSSGGGPRAPAQAPARDELDLLGINEPPHNPPSRPPQAPMSCDGGGPNSFGTSFPRRGECLHAANDDDAFLKRQHATADLSWMANDQRGQSPPINADPLNNGRLSLSVVKRTPPRSLGPNLHQPVATYGSAAYGGGQYAPQHQQYHPPQHQTGHQQFGAYPTQQPYGQQPPHPYGNPHAYPQHWNQPHLPPQQQQPQQQRRFAPRDSLGLLFGPVANAKAQFQAKMLASSIVAIIGLWLFWWVWSALDDLLS